MSSVDSIKISKHLYDSIITVRATHRHLFPIKLDEGPVQAALIVAITTITTVILGFIFKDYWIPGWVSARDRRQEGRDVFKRCKTNLFKSSVSFAGRIAEIYRIRSHYLWSNAPRSEFYDYKYKSSVYRLCVLLGWIQAYRLQEAAISIKKSYEDAHRISKKLEDLEASLADGQLMEMYVVKEVCKCNQIDWKSLAPSSIEAFSVEIDHLIHRFQSENAVKYIIELQDSKKDLFIEELALLMQKLNLSIVHLADVKERVLNIVSVRLGLIYRDWQNAIGNLMLEKDDKGLTTYNVISYKKFEAMWAMGSDTEEKKWLIRAEKLFDNLDLRVDENTDSRIKQMKRVYSAVYNLLSELYHINIGGKPISEEKFKSIPGNI